MRELPTRRRGYSPPLRGKACLLIDRSADPPVVTTLTSVLAEAESLAGFGSVSLPLIVAALVMVPAVAGAVALVVRLAVAALAREPTSQVTVPEALVQVPWEELAETKPTPAGRLSLTVTPVAPSGPLLVAVRL